MNQGYLKYKLVILLGTLLLIGFVTISTVAYVTSREAIRQNIVEQMIPLVHDNLYSEIQRKLVRPVRMSSSIADDVFLREWLLRGEKVTEKMKRYLASIDRKNEVGFLFFVSERTGRYYTAQGITDVMSSGNQRDHWYFRFRDSGESVQTTINQGLTDPDSGDKLTSYIFSDHRMVDGQGHFLGVAGIAVPVAVVLQIMARYSNETYAPLSDSYAQRLKKIWSEFWFGRTDLALKSNVTLRSIYFVDVEGRVVLSNAHDQLNREIKTFPVWNGGEGYDGNVDISGDVIRINSRFIPELGWYLIVEENIRDKLSSIQYVFTFNLIVSAVVSLMVLFISIYSINHQQNHLIQMATTDGLTGLMNRHSFDITFQQALREMRRSNQPLSILLYDIDFFKKINDVYGHLAGDRVIVEVTNLSKNVVRGSDLLCRWGGEEFVILLKNCTLAQAMHIAEQLRSDVMQHDFQFLGDVAVVTISVGVAQCADNEQQDQLFARVDNAMYCAKTGGRNRVEVAQDAEVVAEEGVNV